MNETVPAETVADRWEKFKAEIAPELAAKGLRKTDADEPGYLGYKPKKVQPWRPPRKRAAKRLDPEKFGIKTETDD